MAGIFIMLLLTGCTSHPQGPPGKNILNENQLVDLLVDMHYYESVFTITGHSTGYRPATGIDSVDYYRPVLDMHGIGREEFVESMRYYSYNPPQFEALYNRVVDEINRHHARAQMEQTEHQQPSESPRFTEREVIDIWPLEEDWIFPAADTNKMIAFEIPVFTPGVYTFSADIKLDPEDHSVNPAVNIWFWRDDGIESGHRERFGRATIIKDGKSRHISFTSELADPQGVFIRGRVLDMSNTGDSVNRHGEVSNISLTRTDVTGTAQN